MADYKLDGWHHHTGNNAGVAVSMHRIPTAVDPGKIVFKVYLGHFLSVNQKR